MFIGRRDYPSKNLKKLIEEELKEIRKDISFPVPFSSDSFPFVTLTEEECKMIDEEAKKRVKAYSSEELREVFKKYKKDEEIRKMEIEIERLKARRKKSFNLKKNGDEIMKLK